MHVQYTHSLLWYILVLVEEGTMEPKRVWDFFYEISRIPRCSQHEEKICTYLENTAKKHGLSCRKDTAGNVCITKKAFPGFENRKGIILQGHVDMVCEKNSNVSFNFDTDALKLKREGDWLTAEGTTLGADNGIAVAMALAVLTDPSLKHGPLEALFTVDEETGLTGAAHIDPSLVTGKVLLNIDSEEEGIFYIGCAGGVTSIGTIPVAFETPPKNSVSVTVSISGLRGGHSGGEIHKGWGNAVVFGARILQAVSSAADIRLYSLDGGNKHNAIPRECTASFTVSEEDVPRVYAVIDTYRAIFEAEYGDIEPNLRVESAGTDSAPAQVLSLGDSQKIITTLFILPHGVMGMSRKIPGLVETSTNLAAVHMQDSSVTILTSQRSSVMSALDHIAGQVQLILTNAGAAISLEGKHAAWEPDPSSSILKTFKEVYKRTTSREAEVTAIHAGLECGVLGEKFPGMEMISFGPDMLHVHTPDEKVNIPSVERTWEFLLEVLKTV